MRRAIQRTALSFMAGFIVTFLIYLLIRFDSDKVLLGLAIGAAGGAVLTIVIAYLGHRLGREDTPTQLS